MVAYAFVYEARPLVRYFPTWENKDSKLSLSAAVIGPKIPTR
jgi:hypothetical protein